MGKTGCRSTGSSAMAASILSNGVIVSGIIQTSSLLLNSLHNRYSACKYSRSCTTMKISANSSGNVIAFTGINSVLRTSIHFFILPGIPEKKCNITGRGHHVSIPEKKGATILEPPSYTITQARTDYMFSLSLSSRLSTFPAALTGISSMKCTSRMCLYFAIFSLTKSIISSAFASVSCLS
jgi:hypothetical protein